MNPLLELRRLVAPRRRALTGAVVEVSARIIKVRTPKGIIEARAVDATFYVAGDEVLVRDGLVQGKVRSSASVPIYNV